MLMHRSRWPTSLEAPYGAGWNGGCGFKRRGLGGAGRFAQVRGRSGQRFRVGLVRFRAGNEGLRNLLRENPEVEDLRREIMRFLYRMIFVF